MKRIDLYAVHDVAVQPNSHTRKKMMLSPGEGHSINNTGEETLVVLFFALEEQVRDN